MNASKLAALTVFGFTVVYALLSLVGGHTLDALVAACIATVAALTWLVIRVREEQTRLNVALATLPPLQADEMAFDRLDGTPFAYYRDGILPPFITETVHTPAHATEVIDGGRKPHWDTDVMGAPE